ncbi:hypothetical protein HTS61_12815 [Escherichia coli]|nr:hypothetical protein [Escherichia coli]
MAGEKINLFKIQSDNIRRVSLQAFISHEIARYLGKYAKSTPSLSGKPICPIRSEERCALPLVNDMALLSIWPYFVKCKRDNENYYRSIFL